MKTFILLSSAVLLPLAVSHAQMAVHDAGLDTSVVPKLSDILAKATSIEQQAVLQLAALNKLATDDTVKQVTTAVNNLTSEIHSLATIIGDPGAVPKDGFETLGSKVQDWIDKGAFSPNPSYDKDLTNPTSPNDGQQAFFNATAGGLFAQITDKFKPDPSKDETVDRDKSLYAGQVDTLAAVTQYYQNREAALERRTQLQDLLKDSLDVLKDATDFATLQKNTALVNAIENQLQITNDDLNSSFNEVAVRALQMFTASQVQTTAANEVLNKQMTNKLDALNQSKDESGSHPGAGSSSSGTPPAEGGKVGGGTYDSGFLPWKHYTY